MRCRVPFVFARSAAALAILALGAAGPAAAQDAESPLARAVRSGDQATVGALLDGGADPTEADADGDTPLHYAARYAHPDLVRLLAQQGAALDARGRSGMTPLMQAAAWSGDSAEAARALVEAGADVSATADDGRTALHYAAAFDAPAVARVLLDAGADPDADAEGEYSRSGTPLFWAFSGGVEASVAPLLLEAGADPLADSPAGVPVVAVAARDGHLGLVLPILEARPETRLPAMVGLAAERGDAAGVGALLALGLPPDAERGFGQTPLVDATILPGDWVVETMGEAYDPAGVLRALLDAGADPDLRGTASGLSAPTPLQNAAWEGRADLVALLLDAGADPAATATVFDEEAGAPRTALELARYRLDGLATEDSYGPRPDARDLLAVIALLD